PQAMAKSPPKAPKGPKRKDPARPTRAKASRPEAPPMPDALADLLNPGIARGAAGPGSGTGDPSFQARPQRAGKTEDNAARAQSGLTPPPDNSWDRRREFSAAHTARKSARAKAKEGLGEAPQRDYAASPITGL